MANNIFCPSNSQIIEKNLDILAKKPCYSDHIFVSPLAIQYIIDVPLYARTLPCFQFPLHYIFTKKLQYQLAMAQLRYNSPESGAWKHVFSVCFNLEQAFEVYF